MWSEIAAASAPGLDPEAQRRHEVEALTRKAESLRSEANRARRDARKGAGADDMEARAERREAQARERATVRSSGRFEDEDPEQALSGPSASTATMGADLRGADDRCDRGARRRSRRLRGSRFCREITIQPGGHTGWHSHPGPTLATIKSGTLTLYDGDDPNCTPHVYNAGSTFVDEGGGHTHIARNEGATPVEVSVTYLTPVGAGPRTDVTPAPGNCTF